MSRDQDELAGLLGARKGKAKSDPHLGKTKRVLTRYVGLDGEEIGTPTPSLAQRRTRTFDIEAFTPEDLARMRVTPFPRPKLVLGDAGLRRLDAVREQIDRMAYLFDPVKARAFTVAGQDALSKILETTGATWWPETSNAKTQIGPTDV